jgi:hypothetical protein
MRVKIPATLVAVAAVIAFSAAPAFAAAPSVVSESTAGVTPYEATLEAQIDLNDQETTYSFEYATNEALTGATRIPGEAPFEAEEAERTASVATGAVLAPGTTYYYRAIAENTASEKAQGAVEHFTTSTLEKPVVEEESVSGLTATSVKVEAQVNPSYQETACVVRYWADNDAENTGPTVPCTPTGAELGEGDELVAVSAQLEHLSPGVSYDYRVIATNATGETPGAQASFTTLDTPAVTTAAAAGMTRTTATLSGTADPVGTATSYYFAYVDQAGYEAAASEGAANPYADGRATAQVAVGSSYEPQAAGPLIVEELVPGTTYDYAVIAVNSVGTTIGPDQTFTTAPPTPPAVSTGGAEEVSQISASITGAVDTQGLSTISRFEFGLAPYGGEMTPATVTSSSGRVLGIASAFAGDLQPGATYYYRVVASNQDGTSYGTEQSFTTGSFLAALAPSAAPALLPYTPISVLDANEAKEGKTASKPLTSAQKLTKALKACGKKPKAQRPSCKRQALQKYEPSKRGG